MDAMFDGLITFEKKNVTVFIFSIVFFLFSNLVHQQAAPLL